MENRNILMVIISVSALFVIVFGIAIMITWPRDTPVEPVAETAGSGNAVDVISWMRDGQPLPGLEEPPEVEEQRVLGEAEAVDSPEAVDSFQPVFISEEADRNPVEYNSPRETITKTYNTKKPTETHTTDTPRVTTPKATENAPKRVTNYWIQAGSFKSRNSAESQNNILAEKGFFGQIQTRTVDGSTFYRVRIGPYTRKAEADKFLTWIKEIRDMESSYISEVYVMQ